MIEGEFRLRSVTCERLSTRHREQEKPPDLSAAACFLHLLHSCSLFIVKRKLDLFTFCRRVIVWNSPSLI